MRPCGRWAWSVSACGQVLVPDVGRQRTDADQVELVEVDGVMAVGAGGPERDVAGARIDQPPALVAVLVPLARWRSPQGRCCSAQALAHHRPGTTRNSVARKLAF